MVYNRWNSNYYFSFSLILYFQMMIYKNNKLMLNGILLFSILSLSIAYFVEYILGHKPCNLCIIERYPYIGAIILIPIIFILNRFEKFLSIIILLLFILGIIISIYHVGIEKGFFDESFVCKLGGPSESISKEELLQQLKKNQIISCKDVTFVFFGQSLATINAIFSVILSGIMLKIIKNYD